MKFLAIVLALAISTDAIKVKEEDILKLKSSGVIGINGKDVEMVIYIIYGIMKILLVRLLIFVQVLGGAVVIRGAQEIMYH